MLEDGDYVTNNCINNKCTRCGSCCGVGPMPITRHEEKIIRKFIKDNNIEPMPEQITYNKQEGKPEVQLHCCFYDWKNKKCNIYKVRPDICRSFKCNMTPEQIHNNKARTHARGFWNHLVGYELNKKVHLTNFDILFYDNPFNLFRWFVANLEADRKMSRKEAVNYTINFMLEYCEYPKDKLLSKIEKELRKEDDNLPTTKDTTTIPNDTRNNSI